MEKLLKYRSIIERLLTGYVKAEQPTTDGVEEHLILDPQRDHYQILAIGWQNNKRVFFCILHLDIIKEKIWIQENSTDYDIAADLMEQGVSQQDIVIGFQPKEIRARTRFAVA